MQHLKQAGYRHIEVFQNGRQAYEWLVSASEADNPQKPPDAIISDIEMPSMDGLTLCRRIRQQERLEEVPFIMFSSLINPMVMRKCRAVGADHCVTKPEMDHLVAMLDEVVVAGRAQSTVGLD